MTTQAAIEAQEDLQTRLVNDNIKFAYHIAKQYIKPGGAEPDELRAASLLGLVRAAHSFDPTKGYKFTAYAAISCHNEIRYYLRSWSNQTSKNVSIHTPIPHTENDNGDELEILDTIEDKQDFVYDLAMTDAIHYALLALTDREREIIELRYFTIPELSQQAVAERVHISQGCISKIERKALKKMRELLLD